MMLLVESISAITSWEDYEYQGHMALYVTLRKIYEMLSSNENISLYELQIEGEEDFSFRKGGKYISLHQVKAGAIKLSSNDKFAFIIEILQNNAEYGYFHIANGRTLPTDFVSSTLSYFSMLKAELKKPVIEKRKLNSYDREEDFIVIDNVSANHKKADIYSIIKYVSGNSKDINKIKSVVNKIDKALNEYQTKIKKTITESKKTNTKLLDDEAYLSAYHERFDNAKEIRESAYGVIIHILRLSCPQYTFVDKDYAALVYDQLLLYIKKRITDFYIEKNRNGKCIFTFDEIKEQVLIDYHEKIDTLSYQYFQVLRGIRDAYAEYPSEKWTNCSVGKCSECLNSKLCNLFKQVNILNSKTQDEKNQIIHNLLLRTPQVGKNNNLPSDGLISHLFLFLLDEIKSIKLEKNNVYQTNKNGLKTYRMTLDSSYDIYEFQKNLQLGLQKESNRSLLYECDVLITDRLCENTIFFNGADVNVLTEKELSEISRITSATIEKIKKDCNRPKVIKLIDGKTAIGELK